jgi:DNA repair protein RecO
VTEATNDGIDGIVVRLVDHQERNRIVTLFTPHVGQVATYARGVRGSKKRFAGHVDLFNRGTAQLTRPKRGGMPNLKSFDLTAGFEPIRQDILRFAIATFFIDVVLHTSAEGDGSPKQFEVLLTSLQTLAAGEESARRDLILAFQLQWFDAMGELPSLDLASLAEAGLPLLEDQPLAITRALLAGVAVPDLDPARFHAVGLFTRAIRRRLISRPLKSTRFLFEMLRG